MAMSLQGSMAVRTPTVSRSGFLGRRCAPLVVKPRAPRAAARPSTTVAGLDYPSNWLRRDPLVFVLGFLGWTIPSNIGVPAFGGNSLFGLFTQSIGANLAKFPQGPALEDPFWLYLVVYHAGLFLTLLLGQIGFQGRKQGYW